MHSACWLCLKVSGSFIIISLWVVAFEEYRNAIPLSSGALVITPLHT